MRRLLGVLEKERDGQCGWRGLTLPGQLEVKWEKQAGSPVHGKESEVILWAMGGQQRILARVDPLYICTASSSSDKVLITREGTDYLE